MSQKWFQSKWRKTLFFSVTQSKLFFAISLCVLSASSPLADASVKLPKLMEEVETKYQDAKTIEANFLQTTDDPILKRKKVSSGRIYLKRPAQVRWETTTPDANLFVSNGEIAWFYTPPFDEDERGQLIEKNASEVQSQLASALLAGSFSDQKDLEFSIEDETHFVLVPKEGTAGTVKSAQIEVNPETKFIQKVVLNHHGGHRAEIALSQIKLGASFKDDFFDFKAPPNTDRISDLKSKAPSEPSGEAPTEVPAEVKEEASLEQPIESEDLTPPSDPSENQNKDGPKENILETTSKVSSTKVENELEPEKTQKSKEKPLTPQEVQPSKAGTAKQIKKTKSNSLTELKDSSPSKSDPKLSKDKTQPKLAEKKKLPEVSKQKKETESTDMKPETFEPSKGLLSFPES